MDCTPQAAKVVVVMAKEEDMAVSFGNSCSKPSFHICM
jgi:hypothetical protein